MREEEEEEKRDQENQRLDKVGIYNESLNKKKRGEEIMNEELSSDEELSKKEIKEQPKAEKIEKISRKWMEEIEEKKKEKENGLNDLKLKMEELEAKLDKLEDEIFAQGINNIVNKPGPEFKELIKIDIEDPREILDAYKEKKNALREDIKNKEREIKKLQGQIGFLSILLQDLRKQYGP